MRRNNPKLKPLPLMFYAGANVDIQLLQHVFQVSVKSSGYSKKIAKLIQHDVPRKHEDRLALISHNLPDTRFRARWYEQMDNKKSHKTGWRLFFQMVNDWVLSSVPALHLSDPETRNLLFFVRENVREYMHPTAVSTVLEMACDAGVDPNKIALFIWSYAEAATWYDYEPGQIDVNVHFTSVDQPRFAEYSFKVTELFRYPDSIIADPFSMEEDAGLEYSESLQGDLGEGDGSKENSTGKIIRQVLPTHVVNSELQKHDDRPSSNQSKEGDEETPCSVHHSGDGSGSEFLSPMRDKLVKVEGAWQEYLSKIAQMTSVAAELEKKPEAITTITSLEMLVSAINIGWKSVQEAIFSYHNVLQNSLDNLGRQIIGQEIIVTGKVHANVNDMEQWLRQQANELEAFCACEKALISYRDCVKKLEAYGVLVEWEGRFDGFSGLITLINSSVEKNERHYRELERIELFKRHCVELSANRDWNPLSDEVVGHDGMKVMCSPLREGTVTPYLVGVSLRILLEGESTEYTSLIGDVLNDWSVDLVRTCKILSVLNRQQLDRLWNDYTQMRPVLTLCVLSSWLYACDNKEPSMMDYWYWIPLKEASAERENQHIHISGSAYKFLYELKILINQGVIRGNASLQRLVAESAREKTGAKHYVNYLYDQVKKRVLPRPHYGGNYCRLAVYAYEQLFLPLHHYIEVRELNAVRRLFHEIRDQFDFGDWFARNSDQFKRYSQISSEHKKMIQQYIDDRFHYLDEWLDAEFDTTGENDEQISRVQSSVIELLAKYEKRGSQDDYLATIGWWVNELGQDGGVPVMSAGNLSGALNMLPVPLMLIEEQEFPWRCIEAQVEKLTPTWEMYIADALSLWSNPDIESVMLREWQESDLTVCLSIHIRNCERQDRVVVPELIQWVSSREDELRCSLANDLKEINSKLEAFQSDIKPLFQDELDDIKQYLDTGDWHNLMNRTKSLKEEVCSALENYGSVERRQQLCEDIHHLGGSADNNTTLPELEAEFKKLLEDAKERTVHIETLEKLLQLPELPEMLRDEIDNLTQTLNKPKYLPEADRAEWFKCILETVLTPLSEHLENPDILLPVYRDSLYNLLWIIARLLSNMEWVLEPNSKIEKLLVQISDRLEKEHCTDSVRSIKKFLEWLATQNERFNIPSLDAGWVTSSKAHGGQGSITIIPQIVTDSSDFSLKKARYILIDALKNISVDLVNIPNENGDVRIEMALNHKNWSKAVQLCVVRASSEKEEHLNDFFLLGAGLSLAHVLTGKDRDGVVEALLHLINHTGIMGLPGSLSKKTQGADKSPLGVMTASWLFQRDVDSVSSWKYDEDQIKSAAIRLARTLGENSTLLSGEFRSPVLDILWDYASGEKNWGASFRAFLLRICESGGMYGALVFLLKKDPIKMQESRATLLAVLVERATDATEWERLSDFLESERNKQRSKPFTLFAEQLLMLSKRRKAEPATIEVVGYVEKGQGKYLWIAEVEIVPSLLDPPQDILLRIQNDSPVYFGSDRKRTIQISGPFLEKEQIRIELSIQDSLRWQIRVEIQCRVKTLQDLQTEYKQTWVIDTGKTEDNFVAPTPSFVEDCFGRFPTSPMRGEEFVPRDTDEKTIEDMLFNSKRAGSLWITSPRRSGKTSMLFRILDEFSYRKGRDDIVLYFTMDSPFDSEKKFNSWIWRRILKGPENRKLKDYIRNLNEIGETLDMDVEVDIFLSNLTIELLKKAPSGARVYFVIDEIDRFAEMFLKGRERKAKALSIMWQLRNLISSESSIGIVFAGSHAARRFFVADASSPFYNSIAAIHLAPFNVESQQNERRTRAIVQPKSLADIFSVSNDTLQHLVRITAGIPYYMKLLAGATFACAQHAQVFPADVNEGVIRMLKKETGIKTIDMLENPGEDELRTLYAESTTEKALIKGILLAVANIRSPASGNPVNVGELWSERSPLVVRAGLSREIIEPALTSARNMGFLKMSPLSEYKVEFSIPLLGESLRRRFNGLWAGIEHQLEKVEISNGDKAS